MNSVNRVKEFHQAFNCESRDTPEIPEGPHTDPLLIAHQDLMRIRKYLRLFAKEDNRCQRIALSVEELAELTKALADRNLVSTLDAIGDIDYINAGTAICYGVGNVMEEACVRIHESNMSKLEDGHPVYDDTGKVKKGKDYKPVDLTDLVCQPKDHAAE